MYCSTCGVAVAQGLSYCNYCGAKVSAGQDDSVAKSPDVKPEFLVAAMTGLFIFGLLALTILVGVMKTALNLPVERVLGFALFPFLLLLLLEGVFMRLLFRSRRGANRAGDAVLSQGQATKELDAAKAPLLPEAMPSVTEHTTRAFDPVYRERTK
jgi:hypothetical protein